MARLALSTYRGPYSDQAARNAINCIADTIAVALAGGKEPCVALLAGAAGVSTSSGDSLVWGTSSKTSALDAALLNATASHALDYDDICAVFGGHHSAPLVAPLLAVVQERKCTGDALLRAYITGVETTVRLSRALNPEHYAKGWHPTSTIGVFGVAAALGCLLGLDESKLATALAIAASMASGIKANFGSMVKPLHVGACARSGLLAARLAQAGYDAGEDAFEDKQGFFEVYNGLGKYVADRAFEERGGVLEIEGSSVGIKQFPCCGSTHAAVTAALELRGERRLREEQIARIEILPNGNRLAHTNKPQPRTALEGKFSVQYVVARALLSGAVRLEHFSEQAIQAPEIRRLLPRIDASPHPDMPLNGAYLWGAEVIVHLTSGEVLSRRLEDLPCRDGNYPMTDDELWEKFQDCAGAALPRANVTPLFEVIHELQTLPDAAAIARLMAA
nr:MmgE/PrpD family protein [Bordetella sp. LUAb4]